MLPRPGDHLCTQGDAQAAVQDDAQRRAALQPRQAHREERIVRKDRAEADQNRIRMGAHQVNAAVGDLAGDH